jgi:predicted Holliday junction resolvase-like endonuclease
MTTQTVIAIGVVGVMLVILMILMLLVSLYSPSARRWKRMHADLDARHKALEDELKKKREAKAAEFREANPEMFAPGGPFYDKEEEE